ncbi:arylsulfatase [Pontibacter sp. G13]|uniref:arylsulfatase n=1 Tax=Pontibacter sp. G13 TaxID=3074898 RepID=UPI00288B6ED9|nr:arylsulfatase [Pontibacter sp. G13]WNJ17626.1 arylsulfatase [Pontibacter sp. G13]
MTKLHALRYGLLTGLMFLFISGTFAQSKRPNILLIITDDQGYGDLGLHGNPDVRTPNIDAWAQQSVQLKQFYVSPVCAPTRAALMSGQYSMRTGVYDTHNGGSLMSSEVRTLPEALQSGGYRTGLFGKWHLGDTYPYRPQDQGFEEVLTHGAGGIGQPGDHIENFKRWKTTSYWDAMLQHNGVWEPSEGYCAEVFADAALEFMTQESDQPFFTYLAFNTPHEPLLAPESYLTHYDSLTQPETSWMKPQDYETAQKVYAMVENIDDQLGKLLAGLKQSGQLENTLVIFMSDNGPWRGRYNANLRGGKGSVYEGGVKVPCIMALGDRFDGISELDVPLAHYDLMPTLLDLAKVDEPDGLDGKSFARLLKGKKSKTDFEDRSMFYQFQRGGLSPYYNTAIRKGDFKLIGTGPYDASNEQFLLYNLAQDPREKTNLQDSLPEVVDSLRKELDGWFEDIQTHALASPLPIVVGTANENPVMLSRNDMRGLGGRTWLSENAGGFWDVEVAEAGAYEITVTFLAPIQKRMVNLRIGGRKWGIKNTEADQASFTFPKVILPKGRSLLECWTEHRDENGMNVTTPFYVEVKYQQAAASR